MRFDVELGKRGAGRESEQEPMRLLIVGDLMGASAEEALPIDRRPIVRISVDTFDDVFGRFKPSVALPELGLKAPLRFEAIDGFHPDQLFPRVEVFDRLRTLRQRLQNPSTFAAAAAELTSEAPSPSRSPGADSSAVAPNVTEGNGALFDRLLGTKAPPPSPTPEPNSARGQAGVEAFIRSLVAPYITADTEPQLRQLLAAVDAALADTMRSLLHSSPFQRLEATWRSVQWLLASVGEIEADLEVSLLHLTLEDLRVNAQAGSPLERRLEAGSADGTSWSLIVGDFAFGPSAQDMDLLRSLAALLSRLDVPLVAAAKGALVGCEDVGAQASPKTWTALPADITRLWAEARLMPESRFVGLVWPRLLLRLPYGKKSDPIEAFGFEEMPPVHRHEDYLWANGAFAAALTMAREELGASGDLAGDLGDLPAFTYMENDEPTLKPGAEFCMTQAAADQALARGIMPLVSYRNRNAVRLIRLQSIGATALG